MILNIKVCGESVCVCVCVCVYWYSVLVFQNEAVEEKSILC